MTLKRANSLITLVIFLTSAVSLYYSISMIPILNKEFEEFSTSKKIQMLYSNNLNDEDAQYLRLTTDEKYKMKIREILPELDEILNENRTGFVNVSNQIFDFAILGFPKCGTTSMLRYLRTDEIWTTPREQCAYTSGNPFHVARAQEKAYLEIQLNETSKNAKIRGLKCPQHVESVLSHQMYKNYNPKTRFIIGVRHPVRWFESFYNFKLSTKIKMSPTEDHIGGCFAGTHGLCTDRGAFHVHLAKLGKTALFEQDEKYLLGGSEFKKMLNKNSITPTNVPVFLYDIMQLSDENELRSKNFRRLLQGFLGIESELPEMIQVSTKGRNKKYTPIDICDEEHAKVRQRLVDNGRNASIWITNYFLKNESVFVPNKEHFKSIISDWAYDPCTNSSSLTYYE